MAITKAAGEIGCTEEGLIALGLIAGAVAYGSLAVVFVSLSVFWIGFWNGETYPWWMWAIVGGEACSAAGALVLKACSWLLKQAASRLLRTLVRGQTVTFRGKRVPQVTRPTLPASDRRFPWVFRTTGPASSDARSARV